MFESNQFANSPIGNSILEKIELKFEPQFSEIKKRNNDARISEFRYEFDNYVGKAILERLTKMEESSFQAISEWDEKQTEKFAKDILGPIKYDKSELSKLTEFLTKKSKEKTSG